MTRSFASHLVAASICCLASSLAHAQVPGTPTFSKHIAPIFQEKCEACHRPDSIAPMSLVTFEESRPWARSIKSRVASRQMPPWHIDKSVGITDFENDRSLTDKEIDTIVKWVDAGAPKGNASDMPAPKQWPGEQGWKWEPSRAVARDVLTAIEILQGKQTPAFVPLPVKLQ